MKKRQMAYYDSLWFETEKEANADEMGWAYEKRRIDQAVLSLAKKILSRRRAIRILEVGAGKGDLALKILTEIYSSHVQYVGIDMSSGGMRITRQKLSNLSIGFIASDAEHLPFTEGTFDLSICSEVIEHILDKKSVLNQIGFALRERGWLVLTTPNPNALAYVIPRIIGTISQKHRPVSEQPVNELVNSETLRNLLKNAGFEIIYSTGIVLASYSMNLLESGFRRSFNLWKRISERLERYRPFNGMTLYQLVLARKTS